VTFWARPLPEVLAEVGGARGGLASSEAAERLRRWGPNELAPPRRFEGLRELARYLTNPLVLILLLASGVSATFGQVPSAVVISLMLVLSIALNFTQAYRSQAAARRLREQVGHTATVVRDGASREVPSREVVPGDVIHLRAGDLVPADARLLEAKDLFLNEAALTGESLPVEKHADQPGGSDEALTAATPAVFHGTSVVSGRGLALVVHTGSRTEFARIAAHLTGRATETEFERGTRRFGLLILQLVVFLVLFVFLVNALARRDPLESFLFAVALAVGLTPKLLPMIVSVTLASGAVRMARRKVIVKRLAAIENFGSMDILCSDKTGTLTRGEIVLDRHVNLHGGGRRVGDPARRAEQRLPDGAPEPDGSRYPPARAPRRGPLSAGGRDPVRLLPAARVRGGRGRRPATPRRQGGARGHPRAVRRPRARQGPEALRCRPPGRGLRPLPPAVRRGLPRPHDRFPRRRAATRVHGRRRGGAHLAGFAAFLDPPLPGVRETWPRWRRTAWPSRS
jgi:magnesium-transporting ATPase (P-type)